MKIKSSSVSLSNKKKNALPQSKLLKPKKLKPSNKISNAQSIKEFKKEKLTLAIESELTSNKIKNKKNKLKIKKGSQDLESTKKGKPSLTPKIYKPDAVAVEKSREKTNLSVAENQKKSKNVIRSDASDFNTSDASSNQIKQLNLNKVTHAVAALLKLVKQVKKELLDLPDPIFMEVECIKIPVCRTKQLRFKLSHPLINELSEVLLITADKKGAKIYPEKALDYYTELLEKHDIKFIQKVIPMKTLAKEYSQYEMRKKLVDQYDLILAESKIIKSLPTRLGKFALYNRKMPIPVHLDRTNLKQHLLNAISKTQMTVKGTGHKTIVQVGHTNMGDKDVAKNILAVTGGLSSFPGGWNNIRALDIKTPTSISLPVYFSLASPNSVETPVEKPKEEEPITGELSTQLFTKVVVKADGTVRTKRLAEDKTLLDDSKNDEILEEAKNYMQSRKTIRHDENNDSDDGAITAALEKRIVQQFKEENADDSEDDKEEGEEEEEEEEEESEEDEPVAPIVGQKRNKAQKKNQGAEQSPNKKQKKVEQQGKLKGTPDKKEVYNSTQMKKGLQKRGSRGGKKNKLNKSQRKGMIKKKNASKK